MEREYSEILDDHETVDELMDAATELAEAIAEEHFETCYGIDICDACADINPIHGSTGPWVEQRAHFEAFADTVEEHVAALGGELTKPLAVTGEAIGWVHGDLRGAYLEAFDEAAAAPSDCLVCTGEVGRDDDACGHELEREECPVA